MRIIRLTFLLYILFTSPWSTGICAVLWRGGVTIELGLKKTKLLYSCGSQAWWRELCANQRMICLRYIITNYYVIFTYLITINEYHVYYACNVHYLGRYWGVWCWLGWSSASTRLWTRYCWSSTYTEPLVWRAVFSPLVSHLIQFKCLAIVVVLIFTVLVAIMWIMFIRHNIVHGCN